MFASSKYTHELIDAYCLPSAFGVFVVTVLKMLTNTRKRVIKSAILPGITSGGTTKLIQDTTTNNPARQLLTMKQFIFISFLQKYHEKKKGTIEKNLDSIYNIAV